MVSKRAAATDILRTKTAHLMTMSKRLGKFPSDNFTIETSIAAENENKSEAPPFPTVPLLLPLTIHTPKNTHTHAAHGRVGRHAVCAT